MAWGTTLPRPSRMRQVNKVAAWRFAAALVLAFPFLVMPSTGAAQQAPGTAPRVVETTPTLCQLQVPPNLKEIEVRFDQPMATTSWSWCGGGDHYPEITGRPSFRDAYTCVLPVKLSPQRTYTLSINCPRGQNFRGANGLPAVATQLSFVTASGDAPITARMDNKASWDALTSLFSEIYSYYDRTGTDWKAVFEQATPAILESPSIEEFVSRTAMVLGAADDPHLALRMPDGTRVRTARHFGFYNANQSVIERTFGPLTKHNNLVWSGKRGRIGYIAVHGWDNAGSAMEPIQAIMDTMRQEADCLIVDVRGNGGGDEEAANHLARWFIDHNAPYAKHRFRDKSAADGWGPMRERWIEANPPERRYEGRTFLLQGSVCLSSNEAFIEMMRQSPRVTTVGATSGGSSANPRSFDLPNGTKIVIPRWQSYSLEGVLLEGRGIAADIPVDGDFNNADPVLEKALELASAELGRTNGATIDAETSATQPIDGAIGTDARNK
ncbi:hypothetical protein IT570_13615 [Candidatus Sumerlaeota bacterium]|nr:hypothetical protein [Candidatus Sumerlaeota bacterium]